MRIGITGGNGFLGWHLRVFLHGQPGVQVTVAGRDVFAEPARLRDFVATQDSIFHFAGMNRGDEAEVERTNLALTDALITAVTAAQSRPQIVFANSTHRDRASAYGRAKRESARRLSLWAGEFGTPFVDLVLPGLFGEHGRPFYNSVVSTFCHQLSRGETPVVHEDRTIELVHAQTVAAECRRLALSRGAGEIVIAGRTIGVRPLLARLSEMLTRYRARVIPDLADPFDLALFNTMRSYLYPNHYPVALDLRADQRGALFEAVRTEHGGQCFLSTTAPGITRGNHYHRAKFERFCVVRGRARISLRRLFDPEAVHFDVSGDAPSYVDMPTFHTHSITNTGDEELLTLFWAHEFFDPARPDTYSEPVHA